MSPEAMGRHRVAALDRLAVEPADHPGPAGGPVQRTSHSVHTGRLHEESIHGPPLVPPCPAGRYDGGTNLLDPTPGPKSMTDPPSNIRAHQAEQVLELAWPDDRVDRLPYRYLRGECPCATCRDEWTGDRILDTSTIRQDLKLEGMEPVGSYAVRLAWNDGHSSGLFSWENLRRLAEDRPA